MNLYSIWIPRTSGIHLTGDSLKCTYNWLHSSCGNFTGTEVVRLSNTRSLLGVL